MYTPMITMEELNNALDSAKEHNHLEIITMLEDEIAKRRSVYNENNYKPLQQLFNLMNVDEVNLDEINDLIKSDKQLLSSLYNGYTALGYACRHDKSIVVELLISLGANFDQRFPGSPTNYISE